MKKEAPARKPRIFQKSKPKNQSTSINPHSRLPYPQTATHKGFKSIDMRGMLFHNTAERFERQENHSVSPTVSRYNNLDQLAGKCLVTEYGDPDPQGSVIFRHSQPVKGLAKYKSSGLFACQKNEKLDQILHSL